MSFDRKTFEIVLPISQENLTVRRVNSSEIIVMFGGLPDYFKENKPKKSNVNVSPEQVEVEEQPMQISSKQLIDNARWTCKGIVKHGSLRIVPVQSEDLKEGEISFFELDDMDALFLSSWVIFGNDSIYQSKKKELEAIQTQALN